MNVTSGKYPRVQKLIDLYRKNHVEYPWTQEDKNEQIFDFRKTLRPDTYRYNIRVNLQSKRSNRQIKGILFLSEEE